MVDHAMSCHPTPCLQPTPFEVDELSIKRLKRHVMCMFIAKEYPLGIGGWDFSVGSDLGDGGPWCLIGGFGF